jgi:hypothetical protein
MAGRAWIPCTISAMRLPARKRVRVWAVRLRSGSDSPVIVRLVRRAESCPQADAQSEGRWGAGPLRGPRQGGERSIEEAAVLQLVGNSVRMNRRCVLRLDEVALSGVTLRAHPGSAGRECHGFPAPRALKADCTSASRPGGHIQWEVAPASASTGVMRLSGSTRYAEGGEEG